MKAASLFPATWRFDIQRQHTRGERPFYSLMIAPPSSGYVSGLAASDMVRRRFGITSTLREGVGTKAGVRRFIGRIESALREAGEPVEGGQ